MRSWIRIFDVALAFITLAACSSESTPGSTPGNTPTPAEDGGTTPPVVGDAGRPPVPGPATSKVNTTTETIDVGGTQRSYVLSVPKTYDQGRSYPLILALHGDGQDAASFVPFSKLDSFTGDDAILAFPDGSVDLFTPYDENTDQKLIEAIVVALKERFTIDAEKIWGFGYSKGGYQLGEIACKKPGILTAMAIHAGGAPQTRDGNGAVDCPNAIGLATFVTHGANDDPGGGEFGAQYWASRAGCQDTRTASTPAICEAYDGCDAAKPVVFCVVPNQPHYPMYDDAAAHSWAWFKTL